MIDKLEKLAKEAIGADKNSWCMDQFKAATNPQLVLDLIKVVKALKIERSDHSDCYCDCNSGSCPCGPCLRRMVETDDAMEDLK